MRKLIKINVYIFAIFLIAIVFCSYFLGTKNTSKFNLNNNESSEGVWEKSVVHVFLNYPSDRFRIYEPEPYPGDRSILSNFQLLDITNEEPVITGEFWNETKRSGISDFSTYATKSKLEKTTIGKFTNKSGGSYDVDAYLSSGRENGIYTYLVQGDNNDVYVLTLEIEDKYFNNTDVKNIILSARAY